MTIIHLCLRCSCIRTFSFEINIVYIQKTSIQMFKNVFKLSNIIRNDQKRSFLTIVNQGFEAYRTTFGKNPGNILASMLT
jgi:hypothetical protein